MIQPWTRGFTHAASSCGETLRGLLLYAWGWSQVGLYAFYAAIALTAAAVAVLCALAFELLVAPGPARARTTQPIPA